MARRVMSEAQRLNMAGGHFIWIWADTSSTAEFFQPQSPGSSEEKEAIMNVKENYENHMDEYMEQKAKYNHMDGRTDDNRRSHQQNQQQQQYQIPQQNYTRYKQTNINRFHHIIGLRKNPNDKSVDSDYAENVDGIESIVAEKSFLKSIKSNKDDTLIPMKDKRLNINQKTMSNINNRENRNRKPTINIGNNNSQNIPSNNYNTNNNNEETSDEFASSVENSKTNSFNRNTLHIKNINSDEFNANYYDSSSSSASTNENFENEYGEYSNVYNHNGNPIPVGPETQDKMKSENSDFEEDSDNNYGDYFGVNYESFDKANPFVPTTSRRPPVLPITQSPVTPATHTSKTPPQQPSKIATKSMESKSKSQMKSIKTGRISKIQDSNKTQSNKKDDTMFEGDESGENSNDLKAKRANFPSDVFNISSHVLFHHFKDFPVGLLALKPVKMNVDRYFIRSAIRLFASTWSRVEKDEEQKFGSRTRANKKHENWGDETDYEDYGDNIATNRNSNIRNNNNESNNYNNQKLNRNSNSNVNTRFNSNPNSNSNRGRNKYKRDTLDHTYSKDDTPSTFNSSVNSTLSSQQSYNLSSLNSSTHETFLSGLNNTKSNNMNINNVNSSSNFNYTSANQNSSSSETKPGLNKEIAVENNLGGNIDLQKRQNTWWSNNYRGGRVQERPRSRGTPQYKGGCFGTANRGDIRRSESFSR